MRNLFKVNNKHTRTTPMASQFSYKSLAWRLPHTIYLFFFENTTIYRYLFRSGVFLVNFEHISHTIVDFEQVNAGWECSRNFCYCHWQIFQTNFHKKNLEFWGSNITGNIGPLIFWSWYETLLFISVQVFLFIKIGCRIIKRWLFQKNVWVYFSVFIGICYIR